MSADLLNRTMRRLRRLSGVPFVGGLADCDLVVRVVEHQDEAAFEVLMRRHASMVLNVCRRVLRQEQDAEDAFQATFIVLFRKLHTLVKHESIAPWLHRVAFRVALRASKRRRHETALPGDIAARPAIPHDLPDDFRELIDDAINRLPDRLRQVAILCLLHGRSYREAADELGCPIGTVQSRLARARGRLQARLARAGTLAGAALAALSADAFASPLVPAALEAAIDGNPEIAAATLAQQTLRGMWLSQTGAMIAKGVIALAALAVAVWLGAAALAADSPRPDVAVAPRIEPVAVGHDIAVQRDLARIDGEWQLVAGIEDGVPMRADKVRATVVTFRAGGRVNLGCGRLDDRVDLMPGATRSRLRTTVAHADGETRYDGVYELTPTTLRICMVDGDPPNDFVSTQGTGRILWELRRPGAR